jgi:LCP family protein required for cell wall assembly
VQVIQRAGVLFVIGTLALVGVNIVSRAYVNGKLQRLKVAGLTKTNGQGVQNILLVGSTDRCGLKQQNAAFGLCSEGVTGINSDVIMILHLDTSAQQASILSIPRDTFVPNARSTGPFKIDAALYEGSTQLVHAIGADFGIPINHYVELNFDAFQGVVDALGGLRMYFPLPVHDDLSGLDVTTPGCRQLNGGQALAVARARHLKYKPANVTSPNPDNWPQDPESDLSRIRRDHEFLRVLASKVATHDLSNPLEDRKLLDALAPQVKVDESFTAEDMARLLLAFHSVDPNTVPQYTLPVTVSSSSSYVFHGTDYGNVTLPVEPDDHQVIFQFLHFIWPLETMTSRPLPKPSTITVTVQNGTGKFNQATTTAAALAQLGFAATPGPDALSGGAISETLVQYSSAETRPQAEALALALTGVVVLDQEPAVPAGTVNVVTGSDFLVRQPVPIQPPGTTNPTTTTKPSRRATPTTVPTTTTTNPALVSRQLSTPTASTSTLADFDPRSCTPTGGPGP